MNYYLPEFLKSLVGRIKNPYYVWAYDATWISHPVPRAPPSSPLSVLCLPFSVFRSPFSVLRSGVLGRSPVGRSQLKLFIILRICSLDTRPLPPSFFISLPISCGLVSPSPGI